MNNRLLFQTFHTHHTLYRLQCLLYSMVFVRSEVSILQGPLHEQQRACMYRESLNPTLHVSLASGKFGGVSVHGKWNTLPRY